MTGTIRVVFIKILFIIVLLFALWGVLQWGKSAAPKDQDTPIDNRGSSGFQPDAIVAVHTYLDGQHYLTGTISLATPCHQMALDTKVMESLPEQVILNFTVSPPEPEVFCAQVIDERSFATEFQASPNPVIEARVNGRAAIIVIDDQAGTLKQQNAP